MSSEPHDAPVPRDAPAPPGAEDLAAVVDEIEERVGTEERRAAGRAPGEDESAPQDGGGVPGTPTGDVVPAAADADAGPGADDGGAPEPADPTLREDGGRGPADGAPVSEPSD
ncbi:hypothetical protein [Kineococcus indalonis]|uniref:hypothetical protein n=1 Tax=Kineococcus indalonis TaxID=2696566 RepID=UPI001413680C|nr:hypothetical protein [Kineococcus indalonis]NAZ88704.1 hypothetical protein [Kineococcus indalonis]